MGEVSLTRPPAIPDDGINSLETLHQMIFQLLSSLQLPSIIWAVGSDETARKGKIPAVYVQGHRFKLNFATEHTPV